MFVMSKSATDLFNENENLVYHCYKCIIKNSHIEKHQEDIIQEGLLALWRGCMLYNEDIDCNISTYLCTAIKRRMIKYIQKMYKEESISLDSIICDDEVKGNADRLYSVGRTDEYFNDVSYRVNTIIDTYRTHTLRSNLRTSYKMERVSEHNINLIRKILTLIDLGYTRTYIGGIVGVSKQMVDVRLSWVKEALREEIK